MLIRNSLIKHITKSSSLPAIGIKTSNTAKLLPTKVVERSIHTLQVNSSQVLKKSSFTFLNAFSSPVGQQRTFFGMISGYNNSNENLLMLPPAEDPSKKTLVLDMDEVLFTSATGFESVVQTHESCNIILTKRPGIDEFLLEMAKHFEIVLLTSSMRRYADINLEHLPDVFVHRKYRHHIPFTQGKELALMGRDMDKIILIDDNPDYLKWNPENQILMPLYKIGKPDDNLKRLTEVLLRIAKDEVSIQDACEEWNKNDSEVSTHTQ